MLEDLYNSRKIEQSTQEMKGMRNNKVNIEFLKEQFQNYNIDVEK